MSCVYCHSLWISFIKQIFDRGQLVLTLVCVDGVRHRHQPDVVFREKFLGQTAHLNVVPPQAGEVFDEHRRSLALLNLLEHGLEAWTIHGDAGNPIVKKMDKVGVAFLLGNLGEQLLLR